MSDATCKWCRKYDGDWIGLVTLTRAKGGKVHKYQAGYHTQPRSMFDLWTVCGYRLYGQGEAE